MGIFTSKYKGLYENELNTSANLNRLLTESKAKVAKLESQVSTLEGQNGTLKGNVKNLETRIVNLKDDIEVLNQQIQNIIQESSKKDGNINLLIKENTALSERIEDMKKDHSTKIVTLTKSFDKERESLLDANLNLREEVKSLQTKNEELAKFIARTEPKVTEEANTCVCEAEICTKTDAVEVSIDEPKTEPEIEAIPQELKKEVKLSKKDFKKLKKYGK